MYVSGKGIASGTFKILVSGEEIQVDFSYKPGQKPSLTSKKVELWSLYCSGY